MIKGNLYVLTLENLSLETGVRVYYLATRTPANVRSCKCNKFSELLTLDNTLYV
jgi:hypothetical protein